jgi:isoquinoline 1-oxidoreductase subunit alpha
MISLTVNERRYDLYIEPETPLLWVIRDEIGLTGTKYGCGIGQCGACTVHIDGQAVRSCSLQVGDVGAQKITTIEGLSSETKHPVQQAWIAEDVPQCGALAAGRLGDLSWLEERPLSEGPRAFADIDANAVAAAKIVLRP